MAWSTHVLSIRASQYFSRTPLIKASIAIALTLLIVGESWLNIELAWSLREHAHAPPPAPPGELGDIARRIAHSHLFGEAGSAPAPAGQVDFRLLGVLASRNAGESVAILQSTDSKAPLLVKLGESPAPGLQLTALSAHQAELSRAGEKLTLPLYQPTQQATPSLPPSKPVFD